MEKKIIDALKDTKLQEGEHYIELELEGDMIADLHYKLKYDVQQTFFGTYLQPPEWEVKGCEFDIVSLWIADEKTIYPNDGISFTNIENAIEKYLLTA